MTAPSNLAPTPQGPLASPSGPSSTPYAPRAFSAATFGFAAAGILAAPLVAGFGQVVLLDRLGLASGVATLLAILGGAVLAVAGGLIGAAVGRRIGFYEIATATLVLLALLLGPVLLALPRLRPTGLALVSWEAQGPLVVVLGLLLASLLAGTCAFVGASFGFLLFGGGRVDPSLSYELFVARSHLRLSPRTLLGLFLLVVTGIVPGLLVAMASSYRRARAERRSVRRGELVLQKRMPATLLMTLISIGGVAIGVWALTVVLSVMSGFEGDLKAKILGTNAHGIVMKYGQNDFTEWRETRQRVLAVPGVVGATPFLYNEVMLSADQNLTGAVLKGIDPSTVGTVTHLPRDVLPEEGKLEFLDHPERIPPPEDPRAGEALLSDEGDAFEGAKASGERGFSRPRGAPAVPAGGRVLPGIAIGKEMARSLRVSVGDIVNVISPLGDLGPAGPQPKSRPFRVAAVIYTGMYEYDSKFAYIQLEEAQRFFGTNDAVTGLELKVSNVDEARPILRRVLTALEGYPFRVRDWGQLNRNLFSALMMEKVVMAIILGFIVLVASFIIVATLIMQVLDKRREIAVLKAMGAGQSSIMKIFVAEGVIIGAVGMAFGLLLGVGTCLLIEKVGIPLDPEVYYISNLPVRMDPTEFGLVALLALALSYLATIYPASKASRLEPVEGLRSE
ncbi:MAG TPA: ABC transporter permease [Anaeromyxobacteraceae bacterium]|nr:ABC transporter permease [Anaeromyxobacteraceae bacterium]